MSTRLIKVKGMCKAPQGCKIVCVAASVQSSVKLLWFALQMIG